jgi:hypothetical protein
MTVMLTNSPHIIVASSRRIRKPKAALKLERVIVGPREPAPSLPPDNPYAPAEAADRLWSELVNRAHK